MHQAMFIRDHLSLVTELDKVYVTIKKERNTLETGLKISKRDMALITTILEMCILAIGKMVIGMGKESIFSKMGKYSRGSIRKELGMERGS